MAAVQYQSETVHYEAGQIIALQGSVLRDILFLKKGTVEIKQCVENIKGFLDFEITDKSKCLKEVSTPSVLGGEFLLSDESGCSYVAKTECDVTHFKVAREDLMKFLKQAPQIAGNILLSIKEFCVWCINSYVYQNKLMGEIDKLTDNIEILASALENDSSDDLFNTFESAGGALPESIDASFLLTDNSQLLDKVYSEQEDVKEKYDWETLEFANVIVRANPQAFQQIIHSQISIFNYIYKRVSLTARQVADDVSKLHKQIQRRMDFLYDDPSSQLFRLLNLGSELLVFHNAQPTILKGVATVIKNVENLYVKNGGHSYENLAQSLQDFMKSLPKQPDVDESEIVAKEDDKPSEFRPLLKNGTQEILAYSGVSQEIAERMEADFEKIQKINFKDPTEKDSRRIIKELQRDFFELFTAVVFRYFEHKAEIPLSVKLFMYFGFIKEDLLEDNHLDGLCNAVQFFENSGELDYPILTAVDYLESIYKQDEVPGLSLNGEDYIKTMRHSAGRGNEFVDSPEKRVVYEIDNMFKESMRITSDSPRAYIPFLTSNAIKGNLSNLLNTPKHLNTEVKKINTIDPTLFFRELTWKIPGKSELITKEVKPYLIIVPNTGVRVQLWQEMVNNQRHSRARLIIPTIFNGMQEKSLIQSFAHFRWELNKLIAGANWMDPVEGGFVGAFYDFSQYYQKMNELSIEAKEDIKMLFNKIKMDRDRFAYFYEKWLLYEKDGVAKVNKIVRQIFYRYIPFPKHIRERLSHLPLFEDLNNRYNNITNRTVRSLEAKYRKYEDASGQLPEDLQAYLDILRI